MRGSLSGTRHTTLLSRDEPMIVDALSRLAFVKKVEPLFINWTGPTRSRLRVSIIGPRVIDGSLFLGNGKRNILILLHCDAAPSFAELARGLSAAVKRFGIDIQIKGSENMTNTDENQPVAIAHRAVPSEEAWVHCLMIYEQVVEYKRVEDEEVEVELRLEELRQQKRTLREAALQALDERLPDAA
jgi:hypothetical protein